MEGTSDRQEKNTARTGERKKREETGPRGIELAASIQAAFPLVSQKKIGKPMMLVQLQNIRNKIRADNDFHNRCFQRFGITDIWKKTKN